MAKAKNGRKGVRQGGLRSRQNAGTAPSVDSASPNPWEILGRFDQALSVVVVCQRSLAAKHSAEVGDEEEVLRRGIRLLRDVHNEFDLWALANTERPSR
jgi:hypothetical protein